jgi:hypothetical protein
LLSSHFLFFSGAEEGEDTAIASLASIGAAQPKLESIPEGRWRPEEWGMPPVGGEGGEEVGVLAGQSKAMRQEERGEEVIYTGCQY